MADNNQMEQQVETERKPLNDKMKVVQWVWFVCVGLALLPVVVTMILIILELSSYNLYREIQYRLMGNSGIIISLTGVVFAPLASILSAVLKYYGIMMLTFCLFFVDLLCVYMNICAFL